MKNVTFFVVLLALVAATAAGPSAPSLADGNDETWSAFFSPVADVWASRMGYNMQGRAPQTEAAEENTSFSPLEADDSASSSVHLKRNQENGGGACDATDNTTSVCNGKGDCVNGTCQCIKGWTGPFCHHERKSKLTAFLLEFFVGAITGAGSFYLGYIGQGVGKLVMYWSACLLLCCGNVIGGFTKACCGKGGMVVFLTLNNLFASIVMLAVCIWCFVDWIMILTDDLNDYDGYYLEGF